MADEATRAESTGGEDLLKQVDWGEVRARMCRVIAAAAKGRLDRDTIEDCVQEACIGLYRAILRGGVQNLEALSVTIAKRAAVKELVRRGFKVEAALWDSVNLEAILDTLEDPAPGPGEEGLLPEHVQFYIRELLILLKAKCQKLFAAWLETLNQKEVAARLGMSHANVRQSWLRCRKHALAVALEDQGPLGGLVQGRVVGGMNVSGAPSDHEWANSRLAPFAGGLLGDRENDRMEAHVRECGVCQLQLGIVDGEGAGPRRHIPDEILARWEQRAPGLRGLQRELVRHHLESCAECQTILRFSGHAPVLPRVAGLEPTAKVLAMLGRSTDNKTNRGGVARTLTFVTPIRQAWTQPRTRVAVAGGILAAAAALVIVLGPLGVTRRNATSTMARVTPPPAPEGSPTPIPGRIGGPPSNPGTTVGRPPIAPSEEQIATQSRSTAESTEAVTPPAPPQTTSLAVAPPPAGTANPPAVPPPPVVAANGPSLFAVTRLHGELPTTAAAASEALERALAWSGAARVVAPDSSPRFAVEFELSPPEAAPSQGRASRGGAEQSPLPAPPAGAASLRYRIVDQWTGEVTNGSMAKVSVAALDTSSGPLVERLTLVLARQLWAGWVSSLADGEIVIRGEGQTPPRVGDEVAIVERGRDILDERTGRPAGFLTTPIATGTVVAIAGQTYYVRIQHASRHVEVGMLASRMASR